MSDKIERLEKTNKIWVLIWSLFFWVIIVVLLISVFSVQQTESGTVVENKTTQTVTCESNTMEYPFFSFDESSRKSLRILAVMNEDTLQTISLQYMLYYDNDELIEKSESLNHAAMNMEFGRKGLASDAIGATYAKLSDGLRFNLYQTTENMVDAEKEYLLLDGISDYSTANLIQMYSSLGMNCESR